MKLVLNNSELMFKKYAPEAFSKQKQFAKAKESGIYDLVANMTIYSGDLVELVFKVVNANERAGLLYNSANSWLFRFMSDADPVSATNMSVSYRYFGYRYDMNITDGNGYLGNVVKINHPYNGSITSLQRTSNGVSNISTLSHDGTAPSGGTYPFIFLTSANIWLCSIKITDPTNNVVRNEIIPALNNYGESCLYDKVSDTLYKSASGNLICSDE